ncbi:MAG TPA: DUF3014 domain-containing protein [Rhodanobacteraceae bacterium]|nr:DUF3014 domain-containing protein [Rhodanobacteraceae bacterium]
MAQHNSATFKIIGAIVVIIIVAIAAWWYFTRVPGVDFSRHGPAPSAPAPASTAPAPIQHPISEAQTTPAAAASTPLPPLDASDDATAKALADLPGASGLAKLLVARGLVPHIVATVDALPRHTIGASILPLKTPSGNFAVDSNGEQAAIAADNYKRYDDYMKIVENVDPRTLVTWYVHWYPLFQEAYRQLGYPNGYFNDRLIEAIDDMLAAPNVQHPPQLVKLPDGHYAFADPTWEGLSVGQKLMIRIGPDHERALKSRLRSIRALLLGEAPQIRGRPARAGSPASAPAPATTAQ